MSLWSLHLDNIDSEFWIWIGILFFINSVFLTYSLKFLVRSYHFISTDPSFESQGIPPTQRFLQRMRWFAFFLIFIRIAFVILYGYNNGSEPTEHSLKWSHNHYDIQSSIYWMICYLTEWVSGDGKVIYVIVLFQNASTVMIQMFESDEHSIDYKFRSHRYNPSHRMQYIQYGGYLIMICLFIHRCIEYVLWLVINDENNDLYYILNVASFVVMDLVFWICLALFMYHFFKLRCSSIHLFHKIAPAMPMYKKRYFESTIARLKYSKSGMWIWMFLYGMWSVIESTRHICRILGVYSNGREFHYAQYWLQWVVCDSILCVVMLCYIKPQGLMSGYANILMKYGRPINNKRRVSLQHIY